MGEIEPINQISCDVDTIFKLKEKLKVAIKALNGAYYEEYPRDMISKALRDIEEVENDSKN